MFMTDMKAFDTLVADTKQQETIAKNCELSIVALEDKRRAANDEAVEVEVEE